MSAFARFSLRVVVRSPYMFQGLANSHLGIDTTFLRDERGHAVIPADQVRGVLQAACRALVAPAPKIAPPALIDQLFGAASAEGSRDEPNRALLITSDLVAREQSASTITRIQIDDETGAAASGALQVIELAASPGADTFFEGSCILLMRPGVDVQQVETLLSRAVGLVPAIGAFKSAGFGEVVAAEVKRAQPAQSAVVEAPQAQERVAYRVTFDRPILVDAKRETDNLFVGSAIVPGAAFKGALATILGSEGHDTAAGDLADALAALRMSHAFPENDSGDASAFPVPLSLYAWEEENAVRFADGLLHAIDDEDGISGLVIKAADSYVVPTHPIDWKDRFFDELARQGILPHSPSLAPQPRTHVKIDPALLVGEDEMLYTTVAQGVLKPDRKTPRAWRILVDFNDVAPEHRATIQGAIARGLFPIGRTGAEAAFEPVLPSSVPQGSSRRFRLPDVPAPRPIPGHVDLYSLTLLTPALLTDPQDDLESQYSRLIAEQTGGRLLRAYTSRRLAGGYIAIRRRVYGETYYPFVLTEPGSVFLVRGGDPGRLAQIARFGLAPAKLRDADPLTWRNCPYLRENGYGEVAFSLVDSVKLAA